ncbi:MAG: glucose-6-phosphate isomerase family protein [Bacteroidota bacterium]
MRFVLPFVRHVDPASHLLVDPQNRIVRRVSDMRGMYGDAAAEAELVANGDPVLYDMLEGDALNTPGDLAFCTTVLHPGKVGDEYFMTKGHLHVLRDRAEVYYILAGRGALVCETPEGEVDVREVGAGDVYYVPGGWAHRTVNVGAEDLVFFAIYPAEAGHDYAFIEERGFRKRIVDDGQGGWKAVE